MMLIMATLLSASNITKAYGRQTVLDGLSFNVPERARIALIGRNGAGKTTLLKILAGQEAADGGKVSVMPGTRLGIIDQEEALPDGLSTAEHLASASGRPTWAVARLGARFGLREAELAMPPARLSGGYQMRVKLVRMLLGDPNLLLLDEPVNYLDLPTLLLLEAFLKRWPGAFLVTSHDRELLRNLASSTWEVERGGLKIFPGEVDAYLDWKAQQAEFARRSDKKLRQEIVHAQDFVDRFRAKASKASQAQSRVKHIIRLRSRLKGMAGDLATATFRIPCPSYVAGQALRCVDLAVGYDGRPVASAINLEFPRGAKVGLVGENGRGKTTLLKTLAGILPPVSGTARWWSKADIGYYSQLAEETLRPQETVLEAVSRAAPAGAPSERILAAAGAFLFRNDDLDKPCSVLSGGERARVRLARLVLQEHNVILLDEPTNHLDAETVEVLADALKDYPGTVIVVSHARVFMNALADRIFEVGHGTVREVMGTYEEYVSGLAESSAAEGGEVVGAGEEETEAAARRERAVREKIQRRERQRVEEKLASLEKEKGKILMYFFENPTDYDPEKQRRLAELEEEIDGLEQRWYALAE